MLRQRPSKRTLPEPGGAEVNTNTPPPANSRLSYSGLSTSMDGADDRMPLLRKGPGLKTTTSPDPSLSERHPSSSSASSPVLHDETRTGEGKEDMENLSRKSQWIVLALASGGCAAFNGVFAKLTTTELTTNFATSIANLLGLGNVEGGVEVVVRAMFFGLNLIFNGIMWALFTKALARGTSTTQVSILNTSSNFMITAVLGFLIFSESLPPLWFLGAALLVTGNVIIGRREEGESKNGEDEHERAENGEGRYSSDEEALLVGEELELDDDLEVERKRKEDEDEDEEDFLQLDLEEENGSPKSI